MLSVDTPRYFHLDKGMAAKLTKPEVEFEKRMKDSVIFVQMN